MHWTEDERFDVIVCGAGPAGATTALFLAKENKKVLLLDKAVFPRDKPCADNKTWKCLDIIKELGLWKAFEKLPKKEIRSVKVVSPSGFELITSLHPDSIKRKGTWFNVPRKSFDHFLVRACKKNPCITVLEGMTVKRLIRAKNQVVRVVVESEQQKGGSFFASVVVGADGSQSTVAREVGISSVVKERFAMNCRAYFKNVSGITDQCELFYLKGICPGYCWIFPVNKNLCNVGIGMRLNDIEKQKVNLEKKLSEWIASPFFSERFKNAKRVSPFKQWGLSVLGARRKCSGNGFVLVGDAGTFAMTFSGEGVGPGMRSGKIAASAIVNALNKKDVSAESLAAFDRTLWKILQSEVAGFRWLEFLLLHEGLFDWVVKKTAKNPELQELSSKMQEDYSISQQLVAPSTLLKLIFS